MYLEFLDKGLRVRASRAPLAVLSLPVIVYKVRSASKMPPEQTKHISTGMPTYFVLIN